MDALRQHHRAWGILVAGILAAGLIWFFWGSEEGRLNAALDAVAAALSSDGKGATAFDAVARANEVKPYLAPEGVAVFLENRKLRTRTWEDVRAALVMWARIAPVRAVEFSKRSHTIEGARAQTKLWVRADGRGVPAEATQGGWCALTWEKRDGDWVIVAARLFEP